MSRVSRYVVDLNRGPDDVDSAAVPRHPRGRHIPARGVVWRARTDGTPLLRAPLTVEQFSRRLELFYNPYHQALRDVAAQILQEHGRVLVLAAHSMPSSGRRTIGGGKLRRADVVPGTRGRSTADGRIIDLIDAHFREAGLTVKHDDPYRGGWTTSSYGAPKRGQHAVQIELNRALYVDERTSEIKTRRLRAAPSRARAARGEARQAVAGLRSVRDRLIDHARFAGANLQAIAAVCRLQVIRILPAELQHTLDRSRDVLVQAIGELDHDDGALARGSQQTSDDGSTGLAANFAKDDFHAPKLA